MSPLSENVSGAKMCFQDAACSEVVQSGPEVPDAAAICESIANKPRSHANLQVWIATTPPLDMRKSFDGLAEVVRERSLKPVALGEACKNDLFSGHDAVAQNYARPITTFRLPNWDRSCRTSRNVKLRPSRSDQNRQLGPPAPKSE